MVKAIGIDPGTKSMDLYGFNDETGEVMIDEAISRDEITTNPSLIMDSLRRIDECEGKIDAIVGPSGYGMHLKLAKDADVSDIMMATFVSESDVQQRLKIIGLRNLMFLMRDANDLNIWFTPSVIHLPTVPEYRKAGKIDMGTADKLFSVVLAMKDQAEMYNIGYSETAFILVEVGFAYTAAMAVEQGNLIDGIGGTSGNIGFLGMGAMDGELAYAISNSLGGYSKSLLFSGGAAAIARIDPSSIDINDFINKINQSNSARLAYEAFIEAIIKDVFTLMVSMRERPIEILLSGRFLSVDKFKKDIMSRLKTATQPFNIRKIRPVRKISKTVKEGAEGAVILANGLAGGKHSDIVKVLRLSEAKDTIFDHIYLKNELIEKIKATFIR